MCLRTSEQQPKEGEKDFYCPRVGMMEDFICDSLTTFICH